jgi:hypothetical protein
MLKAVKTFSASSSSLSPPYRCSSASMSEREELVLVERSIRRRAVGGLSSGNAEWEDVRRTVGGGPKPGPCRGEGVVIDAEFDVSGESTVGSRGAEYQLYSATSQEYYVPLDTGFPNLSRRSSSSSDLNDDPSEPRVMSGSVLPMTVSFEADPEGDASRAVSDEAGIVCFGYER